MTDIELLKEEGICPMVEYHLKIGKSIKYIFLRTYKSKMALYGHFKDKKYLKNIEKIEAALLR